ncbi:hypothetical protein [Streptomyces sp. SR-10]|uniref:hypothetical protein n=1 Tax=Streptomyces sp. SR-10 TaxID=3416442 RepID=UPI003CF20451
MSRNAVSSSVCNATVNELWNTSAFIRRMMLRNVLDLFFAHDVSNDRGNPYFSRVLTRSSTNSASGCRMPKFESHNTTMGTW